MSSYPGIDVSSNNGSINWPSVASAGIKFAIIKATEGSADGTAYVNPQFASDVGAANSASIMTHAYHYLKCISVMDAQHEAQWFMQHVAGAGVKGYLFVDVEDSVLSTDPATLTAEVNAFLSTLAAAGYTKLGVYASASFFSDRLNESNLRSGILKWVAKWSDTLGRNADVWQYTDAGSVSGISGNVDMDTAYNDVMVSVPSDSGTPPVDGTGGNGGNSGGSGTAVPIMQMHDSKGNLFFPQTHASAIIGLGEVAGVISINGKSGVVTLVKGDLGLGSVDNTADADKPVSTAQQAAISNAVAALKAITQNVKITNDSGDFYLKVLSGEDAYAKILALPVGLFKTYIHSGAVNGVGAYWEGIVIVEQSGGSIFMFGYTSNSDFYGNKASSGTFAGWTKVNNSAADVLAKLKTVDGSGSGVDSDTVDGKHYSDIQQWVNSSNIDGGTW